jgi:hypothetical protein
MTHKDYQPIGEAIILPVRYSRLLILAIVALSPLVFAKTKKINQCQLLDEGETTYVLQRDVESPASCFGVRANGITLDLNGHTVLFGANGSTDGRPYYGVVGQACWDKSANPDPKYCGGPFRQLTIRNGAILQQAGAAGYSHAIRMGQGAGGGLRLEKLRIRVSAHSSVPISTIGQKGTSISDVHIESGVTTIGNRHQIEGAAIRLLDEYRNAEPAEVKNVHIVGGAQGGILVTAPLSKVIGNDIALLGRYTNDFAIYLWGERSEASGNNVHGQGRGIQLDRGTASIVRDNRIEVFEKPQNDEYKGCQAGGAYGIQVESRSKQSVVEKNQVLALAAECDARAYRQTDTPAGAGNVSRNNQYVARAAPGAKGKAISASFSGVADAMMEGDTLEADFANVEVRWESARDVVFKNVTFIKGAQATKDYATFYFRPGASNGVNPARNAKLRVIDATFLNGASADSYSMVPVGFEKWGQNAEYLIQWTFALKVIGRDQGPVSGANVRIVGGADESYELQSDKEGMTPPLVLTQFRRYNTPTGIEKQTAAYTVTVEAAGKKEDFPLEVKEKMVLTHQLR